MATYLYYFIPDTDIVIDNQGRLNDAKIDALGLMHIFADRMRCPDDTIKNRHVGPDGIDGTMLYPRPPSYRGQDLPALKYKQDGTQTWHNVGKYWIGVETQPGEPIDLGPDYFAHDVLTAGLPSIDRQGNEWRIPVINSLEAERYCLPRVSKFNLDGTFQESRRDEDNEYWEISEHYIDVLEGRNGHVSAEYLARSVIKILQINYYIGFFEIAVLDKHGCNPMESEFNASVMWNVVDNTLRLDYKSKKKAPDSTSV
jgi:hypothetical protein